MDNKFEVNGDLYGVGIVQDGATVNQKIVLPKYKIPKQLTSKLGKSTIVGRKKELQEIDEGLNEFKTLLIKGIAGVGKSTIASNYLHCHKDKYDYFGFFEGIDTFITELEGAFKIDVKESIDRLDRVLRELINLEGHKLIVIDNVKDIKEHQELIDKILSLQYNGYKILLTSRFKIKSIEVSVLESLSLMDAQKLFLDNYTTEELEKLTK